MAPLTIGCCAIGVRDSDDASDAAPCVDVVVLSCEVAEDDDAVSVRTDDADDEIDDELTSTRGRRLRLPPVAASLVLDADPAEPLEPSSSAEVAGRICVVPPASGWRYQVMPASVSLNDVDNPCVPDSLFGKSDPSMYDVLVAAHAVPAHRADTSSVLRVAMPMLTRMRRMMLRRDAGSE